MRRRKNRRSRKTGATRNQPNFLMRMMYKAKSPAGWALVGLAMLGGGILAKHNSKFSDVVDKVDDKIGKKAA